MADDDSAIVLEVFSRVRDADPRVADLFAPDASLNGLGAVHAGRDAIREFYLGVFAKIGPQPTVRGLWRNGTRYAALVEVTMPAGRVSRAVDVFDIAGGVIRSLDIFSGALFDG